MSKNQECPRTVGYLMQQELTHKREELRRMEALWSNLPFVILNMTVQDFMGLSYEMRRFLSEGGDTTDR